MIFIIRKTFGFNKIQGDRIPFSQIIKGTGVARQSAFAAVHVLEQVLQVSQLLDIPLLDHIVVGRGSWVSMKERQLGFR